MKATSPKSRLRVECANTKCWTCAINSADGADFSERAAPTSIFDRLLALLSAVCAGTLLGSGAFAAPAIFAALAPDHAAAGRLAANIFELCYWFTASIAVLACASALGRNRHALMPASALVIATAVQLSWIVPALRHPSGIWPFSFSSLHATASIVHGAMLLSALWLAWQLIAGREASSR
jgi:hypothetical protein